MKTNQKNPIKSWLTLTHFHTIITNELEATLQREHQLTLKEFYVLLFLSEAPLKKLKLQQLQNMVGLSQSAMSRLVSRFEAKGCGALQRTICEDDRRNIYTSLTQIGEEKVEKALITFNETLLQAFSKVDLQDELQNLMVQLNR
ncbi:MarR family winged helix-turn-helix transcriptional regulator [Thermoflavimicrobium daqui]|uniref:MarR family transcriptional regulator n=1 Tax=Thermoflavimicrobium daqui TaxID=2137476 RepID=A0A364K441_9BACL|nr:MarR family transcriptional regulator [Thermoflavimicrobium daqui]RAL24158.1 MarR family transcriptional regulator [Thermoflavimicrobium daqui]